MSTSGKRATSYPSPPMDRPYVVRYGLWGPGLYLGVPVVVAFGAISLVANMPTWLFFAWNGFLAFFLYLCVLKKEVRILPLQSVIVVRKLLGLVPLWRRDYPMTDFSAVRFDGASMNFQYEPEVRVVTVSLERPDLTVIALQSWSAGANPDPGPDQFISDILRVTRLRRRDS